MESKKSSKSVNVVIFTGFGKMISMVSNEFSLMKFRKAFLMLGIIVAVASQSYALTYYVDAQNGADTSNGSSQYPWKTINKAITAVTFGDTVILKPGDYGHLSYRGQSYSGDMNTKVDQNTQWIRFKSEQNLAATISTVDTFAITLGAYSGTYLTCIIFEDILVKGRVNINNSKGVKFLNCELTGNNTDIGLANGGIHFAGSTDITIQDCKIHHVNNNGIDGSSSNVNIIDNEIFNVGSDHIMLTGKDNILIEGNNMHTTNWWNSSAHPDVIQMYYGPFNNVVIRNNKIHDFAVQGIFCSGAPTQINNLVIENNLFYNAGTVAVSIRNVNGGVFNNNTIADGSLVFSHNIQNIEVRNNLIASYYYALDASAFTYNDYNIFIYGAGGAGYFNIGADEPHSVGYAKGTLPSQLGFFTDALNHNYTILQGTRPVDFGTTLSAPSTDLMGYYRDAVPDAGCYEYIEGVNTEPNYPSQDPDPNDGTTDPNLPVDTNTPIINLVFDPIENITILEGQNINVTVNVTGAPAEDITCTINNLPVGATFTNKNFDWTPDSTQAGLYFVRIVATYQEVQEILYIIITVEEDITAHCPMFDAIPIINTGREGEKFELLVSATDPDGDKLYYSVTGLPNTAVFHGQSIVWVPDFGDAGSYMVQLLVSDGTYETIQNVIINIEANSTSNWTAKRLIFYWKSTLYLLGEI